MILGRGTVNMLKRGVVEAVRIVKNRSILTRIMFVFCSLHSDLTPFSFWCTFSVVAEFGVRNFAFFWTLLFFNVVFGLLWAFEFDEVYTDAPTLILVFINEIGFFLSSKVLEKKAVGVRVRFRDG